jgi:hypothetical protein
MADPDPAVHGRNDRDDAGVHSHAGRRCCDDRGAAVRATASYANPHFQSSDDVFVRHANEPGSAAEPKPNAPLAASSRYIEFVVRFVRFSTTRSIAPCRAWLPAAGTRTVRRQHHQQ